MSGQEYLRVTPCCTDLGPSAYSDVTSVSEATPVRHRFRWLILVGLLTQIGILAMLERNRVRSSRPELELPADPPVGHWADPESGARWEEERRRIGTEMSGRADNGPLRCRLRVVPWTTAGRRELEVALTNTSDVPVTVRQYTDLLDHVTFVFHGPADEVVSSFCYATVRSPRGVEEWPDRVIEPGEEQTSTIYLSVAADHGFQPLRPGRYWLAAVFQGVVGAPGGGEFLSHSARVPIRVR
jgi:hypothetical protein